ncbi:MAG: hypothetical protein HQ472_01665 [Ignavibacteria bacterium]|nr:hypothetical protein [Ignavibacteria bacterium]
MRLALVALFIMVLVSSPLLAQDDRLDEFAFEEVPLKDEPIPYFAIGVGPVFQFSFPNMDDLNARATQLGLGPLDSPLLQIGGELFTAVGLVKNLRVGFSWVAGSLSTTADKMIDTFTVSRTMKYSLSSRTIHIDYAWVPFKRFTVLPGIGFGWGNQTIATYQSMKNRTWDNYADTTGISTSPDAYADLTRAILYLAPRLNVEYAFTPFVAVRAQAAYTLQVGANDWIGNKIAVVSGVPTSINVSAFNAQVGLFIGLFN